jgi:vacuolar-type H+-ATPase subunit F/Vma7
LLTSSRAGPGRVAVVGERQAIAGFRAAGLDVFAAGETDAEELVRGLIDRGYQVVFYTGELARPLSPLAERYRRDALPSIVGLPWGAGGPGIDRLRGIVKRAVGADVFGKGASQ